MTALAIASTETINYEVVWGEDERDRTLYQDTRDGSFLSTTAEVDATRKYLELVTLGAECGLFIDGALNCGSNVSGGPDQRPAFLDDPTLYARWVAGELNDDGTPKAAPPVEHKTRTVLNACRGERYVTKSNGSCGRWVANDDSTALCTCGWKWNAATRDEARVAARGHRRETAEVAS